jgi:hypothetical protein
MNKDEALKLALEALESVLANHNGAPVLFWIEARDAIKQALANEALERKAENARELGLDYEPVWDNLPSNKDVEDAMRMKRLNQLATPPAQPALVQEPVSMRMPKVGDRVVCIDDESLGTIVYLTAGGSPEIKFDDGSHGTYMLREFAELFGYTTPPAAQRQWVGLTDEEIDQGLCRTPYAMKTAEAWREGVRWAYHQLKEKNT